MADEVAPVTTNQSQTFLGLVSKTDGVVSRSADGIPWSIDRRVERAGSSAATTSLLTVASQAGLGLLGFRVIGDVGGAFVGTTGPHLGYGRCAQRDAEGKWVETTRVITHRAERGYYSYGPIPRVFEQGSFDDKVALLRKPWDIVLGRLLAECAALGGDGVIGVRLSEQQKSEHVLEFTALGTAVRYIGSTHLRQPFSTTLSGSDIAKLVGVGYFPAGVIVAVAVGLRHNDYETVRAKRSWLTNVEVPAHTELLNAAKRAARDDMARRAAVLGADGAIAAGEFSVETLDCGCDYAAEVRLIGDALVRFRQSAAAGTIRPTTDLSMPRRP